MAPIDTLYARAYAELTWSGVDDDVVTQIGLGDLARRAEWVGVSPFYAAFGIRFVQATGAKRTRQEELDRAARILKVPSAGEDWLVAPPLVRLSFLRLAAEAEQIGLDPASYIVAELLPERYPHAGRAGRKSDIARKVIFSAAYHKFLLTSKGSTSAAGDAANWLGISNGRDAIQKAEKNLRRGMIDAFRVVGYSREERVDAFVRYISGFTPLLLAAKRSLEDAKAEAATIRKMSRFVQPISAQDDEPPSTS